MNTYSKLTYNFPEMNEIKKLILIDRKFQVDEEFYDLIDDDFILFLLESTDQSEERDNFVKSYADKKFTSYKNLVVRSIDCNNFNNLYLFNQKMVARYCKYLRKYIPSSVMIDIIVNYAKHDSLDIRLVYTYFSIVHPSWFMYNDDNRVSMLYSFYDTIIDRVHELKFGTCEDLITQRIFEVCTTVDNALRLNNSKFSIMAYYRIYPNHPIITNTDINPYVNLVNYLSKSNCKHDVPDVFIVSMNHILTVVSDRVLPLYEIYSLTDLIIESLKLNANNVKLLRIVDELIIEHYKVYDVVNNIIMSEIPLRDLVDISALDLRPTYKGILNIFTNNRFLYQLIESDSNLVSLVSLSNNENFDIKESFNLIITHCSDQNITKLLEWNQALTLNGDIGLLDYVVNYGLKMLSPKYASNIIRIILTNKRIWRQLSSAQIASLISKIDIMEFVKLHPESMLLLHDSLTVNQISELSRQNPDMITYIPRGASLSIDNLMEIVGYRGYIPLHSNISITSEMVYNTIMKYNKGYGYILDLPTNSQKDLILKFLINHLRYEK